MHSLYAPQNNRFIKDTLESAPFCMRSLSYGSFVFSFSSANICNLSASIQGCIQQFLNAKRTFPLYVVITTAHPAAVSNSMMPVRSVSRKITAAYHTILHRREQKHSLPYYDSQLLVKAYQCFCRYNHTLSRSFFAVSIKACISSPAYP